MASSLPNITANLAISLNPFVVLDLNTIWLSLISGQTFLAAPVNDSDTTITLGTGINSPAIPSVGSVVVMGNEAVIVTAADGNTLTVTRAAEAFPFLAALPVPITTEHAANSPVYVLTYASPWVMLADLALRPWVIGQINAMGARSVTFGAQVSGTLSLS